MMQIQEIGIILRKRLQHLEKKKQRCLDYSSTPNRCVTKIEAKIKRLKSIELVSRFRRKALESERVLDDYLDNYLQERKKTPLTSIAMAGVALYGAHKIAKRSICKDRHPRNPYSYKKCVKGLEEAEGWEGLPKGWKRSSIKKFSKSLTGKSATKKGFFDKCVKRMQGKIDNPEAFCAATKDEEHGSTYWRGKGKTPQQAGKDVKRIRNVRQEIKESIMENETYVGVLGVDARTTAKEWQGPNIPYGDDSNRPNLIRNCTMLESSLLKINCLRKLRDQAAMNPFYQYRIDRYIDEITDTYEPTEKPGTIPGNEFKETGVGEDTPNDEV